MCSSEEASLLRLEEVFSAALAHINSLVLQPLLLTEPSDAWTRECLQLLQQLHQSSQRLWKVTEESRHSLRERLHHPDSVGLESLLLLHGAERVLQVHIEYIESYTNCMVARAFQGAAKQRSAHWRDQRKVLQQFLWAMGSVSLEGAVGPVLVQSLRQPLTHHVQQYVFLLLSLGDTIRENHPTRKLVVHAATLFGNLQSFMSQALDEAMATEALWPTLSSRLRDELCNPADRRLLQDSRDIPVTVSPLRADRVLLFRDSLVLLQGHHVHTFDLKLVWVDPGQDRDTLHVLTPEEEFSFCAKNPQGQVAWQRKVTQAVRQALCGKKDFPVMGADPEPPEPPACRCEAYTFQVEGRLCQATYEGEWCWGRPHGKGTLKWPDGRSHVGNFSQGLEHGFGICLVPQAAEDKFDCYKCHWREGSMCGYGICEYGTGDVYKGYFQEGLRHGFGVFESARTASQPCKYTGHWELGQRSGYGIGEDRDRGEHYIGMWQADQRHGLGVLVTQAGVCYQSCFQADKMVALSVPLCLFLLLLELLRPALSASPNPSPFPGSSVRPPRAQAGPCPPQFHLCPHRQLGLGAFPVESRWRGVYGPFWDFVQAGCPGDQQEALLGFHVQSSKELRKSQEYLCCERTPPEDSTDSIADLLEQLPQHREPGALQQYLKKALSNSLHPLGKLLRTLMLTFQATYSGVGANKHLQGLAQEEVKQHARELWAAYRGLLQVALQRRGQALEEDEDAETRDLQVHRLVLPLLLPSFYPELFTLYLLLHEREDSLYSQGITCLSLFPDTRLLEFLDVQKHLWPLKDLTLTTNQRDSLVRDKCFLSAIECLQKMITTVDPREKLEVLERTYREIEATVSRVLGQEHKLPMDDLLPLLIYVVSRARIQHLGAEIHLIRDMMDPTHTGGLYDFLLTALESCYEHIRKEDMQLHRVPSRWTAW
ncbi:ALS2 C-terminal-like protein [Echinops telfairi]|uniref:ALS2 C-terminal-like protein n=1 Tax=Echinops telfairi TaxID=9371 RepID=A0AC55DPG9_ECHTE|nr:ALS2 C-terminal-like protein [Echinops telfairi]